MALLGAIVAQAAFEAETVVVRLPNWVGDAVMATPALRALREGMPDTRIVLVGSPPVLALLEGATSFDATVEFRRGRDRGLRGGWRSRERFAPYRPAVGLLLPHSLSSAIHFRLAGIHSLAGFWSRERAPLLTWKPRPILEKGRRVPEPMPVHYLRLLRGLGLEASDTRLDLVARPEDDACAAECLSRLGLAPDEPYFAINPGASFGVSKCWTVEGFAETVQGLERRHGCRTLVLCGPGEEALASSIAQACGLAAVDTSHDVVPLAALKPVLRDARALITTDTGPRHIATAFDTPTVVVMGPTDPRYTNANLTWNTVLRRDVPCGPCHLKECPIDHRCMTGITGSDVLASVDALLERRSNDPRPAESSPCQR